MLLRLMSAFILVIGAQLPVVAEPAPWQVKMPIETIDGSPASRLSPAVTAGWSVSVEPRMLEGDVKSLRLELPGRGPTTFRQTKVLLRAPDDLTWVGQAKGSRNYVTLTRHKGWLAGRVQIDGQVFELRPDAAHGTVLLRIDPARFPGCGGAETAPTDIGQSGSTVEDQIQLAKVNSSPMVRIDTLIAYTPEVTDIVGGHDQAAAFTQLAVDLTNLTFVNSEVDVRIRVVAFEEVESQTSNTCTGAGGDLSAARANPTLQSLRQVHQADLVAVITGPGGWCGCAYVWRNLDANFFASGYSVTRLNCAVGNMTLAHEFGHNLGMEHDPDNGASPEIASYPFAFGHYVDGHFRTVMSYNNPCEDGCIRQPHFSNPDVSFEGVPTGLHDQRDNAEVARRIAPAISEFFIPQDHPLPMPEVEPSEPEIVLSPGQFKQLTFELRNQGDGSFDWLIQGADSTKTGNGHVAALDEIFHFPETTLDSHDPDDSPAWKFYDRVGGFQSRGKVVGFSFAGDVTVDPGVSADNLSLVIQTPSESVHWFTSWEFGDASGSGHYQQTFPSVFANFPRQDKGFWRFWLSSSNQEPGLEMTWRNMEVILHKKPLDDGCDVPGAVDWIAAISPTSGRLTAGSDRAITLIINTAGLQPDTDYEATLCIAINDPRVEAVEVPVHLHTGRGNQLFRDRFSTPEWATRRR